MSTNNIQPRTTVLLLLIVIAAVFRLVQSSPVFSILSNVTPVGAIALFGGTYFSDRWKAFVAPLLALAISDLFLNRMYYTGTWVFLYDGVMWTYLSFAVMVIMGMFIKKVSILTVGLAAIGATVTHWIISDVHIWLTGTDIVTGLPFTKDFSGFARCLTLALPFMRNMLVGNLVFCAVLYGTFEWAQRRYPALSRA
ncbi:MAG: hypothetical protein JNK10_07140 [Cyclobacteriaceae bacterium]|nr:hypothetical protein [Cyclobacteriaceae bacterium]